MNILFAGDWQVGLVNHIERVEGFNAEAQRSRGGEVKRRILLFNRVEHVERGDDLEMRFRPMSRNS